MKSISQNILTEKSQSKKQILTRVRNKVTKEPGQGKKTS